MRIARGLIVMLMLLVGVDAFSQDYAITLKGDTLRGKANIMNYDILDRVDFFDLKQDKKFKFTSIQLKEVGMNGHRYQTIRTDYGFRMAQLEKEGYLSLYLAQSPRGTNYEVQWLVKKDGSSIEVPNLAFKRTMMEFLSDCDEVSNRIKKEELHRKELALIIDQYNNCLASRSNVAQPVATAIAVTPVAETVSTQPSNPQADDLTKLKDEISADPSMASKNDLLDLMTDIIQKVKDQKAVSRYQLDFFEGMVKGTPYEEKAGKVIASLRK
ncbi:MAG: hypothetical protein JST14_07845 [Bacteroidetes bacterium]|nr:hypothetical protein [Bacteroidota bacterium]MBS1979232.1 hypothetical protein [Bacteroidota bacterium]